MTETIIIKYMKEYLELDKQLYDKINNLPPQLRNYLYIWCMKLFWRQFVPITAKVPMWNDYANYQRNLLFQARKYNIHFLHLPCNTLPENKTYILGCQCYHCKCEVDSTYKENEIIKNMEDYLYYYKTVPPSITHWNDKYEYVYDEFYNTKLKNISFNHDYDNDNYNLDQLIQGKPLYFKS
jgi:hypothetical protein